MSFLSQLDWRFAAKSFDPDKTVSDSDFEKIKEAISKSPTSFGLEPYHVRIVTDPAIKNKIQPVAWGQPQVGTCSHLLVFCARTDVVSNRIDDYFENASGGDAKVKAKMADYEGMMRGMLSVREPEALLTWAQKQAYIAMGFAMAACAEMEIDSCPMEGFEPATVDKILELPDHLKSVLMLPIGYRDAEPTRAKIRFPKDEMFS